MQTSAIRGLAFVKQYADDFPNRNIADEITEAKGHGNWKKRAQGINPKTPRNLNSEELKELIPTEVDAQADEYIEAIKETILRNDPWEMSDLLAEPIYITTVGNRSYILDGHNRVKAFSDLSKPLNVIELSPLTAEELFTSKMEDIFNGLFDK